MTPRKVAEAFGWTLLALVLMGVAFVGGILLALWIPTVVPIPG